MVSPLSSGMCVSCLHNNFSGCLLKVILGIQKFQNSYVAGVMASSSVWRTASTREEIMDKSNIQCVENCIDERRDHGQIKPFCLKRAWPLMVKCSQVDNGGEHG